MEFREPTTKAISFHNPISIPPNKHFPILSRDEM